MTPALPRTRLRAPMRRVALLLVSMLSPAAALGAQSSDSAKPTPRLPKVLLIATGGTIAGVQDAPGSLGSYRAGTLTAEQIVELYDLRWQIEVFFKELKSTLGFHQYRFRTFSKVERWVDLCLITFVYLEWSRAERLANRRLSAKQKRWWCWQRA